MLTLYNADRCPYAARARIVLAEKGVEHEVVTIDLADRPAWLYEKNELGRVPVIEDGSLVLPESAVIAEYLNERYPEPPLWPADPGERALGRLLIHRFDHLLGNDYYVVYRGIEDGRVKLDQRLAGLDERLEATAFLAGREYSLADIAYLPWLLRARQLYEVDLEPFSHILAWIDRLSARPAIAAELAVVATL